MRNDMSILNECSLCPRMCKVDRQRTVGFCRQSNEIKIARADLHMWEEPCISGTHGSGTVFFSGCTLRCIFCQNYEISQLDKGYTVTVNELADIFLSLQEKGAHNINLVSPTPYVPQIIQALDLIRNKLNIPVVYNCGGYERVETIEMLKGYVNIYLPDLKYFDDACAKEFSGCTNYFETAMSAIKEMVRQVGKPKFDPDGIMQSGVIVRHLALPSLRHDSISLIEALGKEFQSDEIMLSLMSQYMPMHKAVGHPKLGRRISTFEYNKVLDAANKFGFEGFSQERSSSSEVYVPPFTDKK